MQPLSMCVIEACRPRLLLVIVSLYPRVLRSFLSSAVVIVIAL